jgi:hypothetical protein
VAGRALEADGDLVARGRRVAPGADLVRGVDTAARRVVGEHQRVLHLAPLHLVAEEGETRDGERLVGGRGAGGVLDAAVVVGLELLEDGDLVPAGVHEDRAVLGARDVPLQTLEDEGVLIGVTGRLDVRVDLVHTDLGVRDAAVVGDDQPVHAVLGALADLVDDAVLAVAAVLRVDVVVARQPEEALLSPASGRRLGGGRRPARRAAEDSGGRQARAEQARAAQHGAARPLVGRQGLVGYGGVEGCGQRRTALMTVVVVVMVVVPVPVAVPHVGLLCPAPPVRTRVWRLDAKHELWPKPR